MKCRPALPVRCSCSVFATKFLEFGVVAEARSIELHFQYSIDALVGASRRFVAHVNRFIDVIGDVDPRISGPQNLILHPHRMNWSRNQWLVQEKHAG